MFNPISVSFIPAENQPEIHIESGKLARQAQGSVLLRQGNCVMLATACATETPREGQSFFPLTVDYSEKFGSAGRIPGSFFKREGRPSDYEVLISRLIDRAIRPLFPEDYRCDVQILVTLISSDAEILPDALACLAASSALAVSNIPIKEILSEVRIGKIDGKLVINPTRSQLKNSTMDFIIAATEQNLTMVEGEANECQEAELVEGLEFAHKAILRQIQAQKELQQKANVQKIAYTPPAQDDDLKKVIETELSAGIIGICSTPLKKSDRSQQLQTLFSECCTKYAESWTDVQKSLAKNYYEELTWVLVRNLVLDKNIRLDGRKLNEIRPIEMEVDFLPSPHGAALFTRGETQSLTTVTLGTPLDELLVESAAESNYSKFILHYNFPPFCTGEVKPQRGPGRREVGHGNLALRSLRKIMPQDCGYTVRVVSDILESNGSSSMATVCAGSLALMDAGIEFKKHVAGIAMGMISRSEDKKYAILTDILGDEDHLGDMDFKVTGTRQGICGVQMDIKVDGLTMEVMHQALTQAKEARLSILEKMYACIPNYRQEVKPHTPRYHRIEVDKEFIGAIIGPQGKVIQEMQRITNTTINIEEEGDKGIVLIFATNGDNMKDAVQRINAIIAVPEVGGIYDAIVKSIQPYGAFVEFLPGKQGLLHVSEIKWERVDMVEDVLQEGQSIKVKLIGTDPKTGKYKFSHKVLIPKS